jgi:hypothetical protein
MCQINPLPALTYQNVLDLNVACQAKRAQTYLHVRKFKCPLKKTQPSCPCSRDLNWTSKGLKLIIIYIKGRYSQTYFTLWDTHSWDSQMALPYN